MIASEPGGYPYLVVNCCAISGGPKNLSAALKVISKAGRAVRIRPAQSVERLMCTPPAGRGQRVTPRLLTDSMRSVKHTRLARLDFLSPRRDVRAERETPMGTSQELKGPDLLAGIDAASVKESEPLLGHANGEAIVLVRQGGGVCAVGATCTHYGGPLAEGIVEGDTIRCPWHHARFDLRTGAPTRPGRDGIPCYRVQEQGGRVRVGERLQTAPIAARRGGPDRVVIVGAGAAGNACAEELRRQGYGGPITIVGSEGTTPVDRPNLSKDYLAGTG